MPIRTAIAATTKIAVEAASTVTICSCRSVYAPASPRSTDAGWKPSGMHAPVNRFISTTRKHTARTQAARIALIDKVSIFGCFGLQRGSNRGHIHQSQLNALFALPAVHCDVARGMQRLAAVFQKSPAQWLTHRPKGDGVDKFSVTGTKASANVAVANGVGVGQRVCGKGQQRLRIAGTEWSRTRQQIGERKIERTRGNRTIQ